MAVGVGVWAKGVVDPAGVVDSAGVWAAVPEGVADGCGDGSGVSDTSAEGVFGKGLDVAGGVISERVLDVDVGVVAAVADVGAGVSVALLVGV